MKKLLIIFVVMLSLSTHAVQYSRSDSLLVVRLLTGTRAKHFKSPSECVLYFGRQLVGVPYVASTLEVNKKEQLIINLRQLDCTTFVENVIALSLCHQNGKNDFAYFCDMIKMIRYKGGKEVSYVNRLHYFTGWIEDNSKLRICKVVDTPNPPFCGIQTVMVDYMSTHRSAYPMLKSNLSNQRGIQAMEKALSGKKYRYIPKSRINNSRLLRSAIHDGDIIAILTNKKGLDTQHIGIAVWHKDGLHLLNASSIHHKVIEEPMLLSTYLAKRKTMTGIRIVRLIG